MNRTIMGVLLALVLSFISVRQAEPAIATEKGCVHGFSHHLNTDGTTSMLVRVGAKWLYFHVNHIKVTGPVVYLTRAQVAAWEPLLADFRAAAIAKVKATVWYDTNTNVLTAHSVRFYEPC